MRGSGLLRNASFRLVSLRGLPDVLHCISKKKRPTQEVGPESAKCSAPQRQVLTLTFHIRSCDVHIKLSRAPMMCPQK